MSYPQRRPRGQTLAEAFAWFEPIRTDGCLLWPASCTAAGYGQFTFEGQHHYAHIVAYELAHGPVPTGLDVDHIDCVAPRCVEPTHLRAATRKQNEENRHGPASHNRSGFRGVWQYRHDRWGARVVHNGTTHGRYGFSSPETAAEWAIAKRLELFTHSEMDRRAS